MFKGVILFYIILCMLMWIHNGKRVISKGGKLTNTQTEDTYDGQTETVTYAIPPVPEANNGKLL